MNDLSLFKVTLGKDYEIYVAAVNMITALGMIYNEMYEGKINGYVTKIEFMASETAFIERYYDKEIERDGSKRIIIQKFGD